MLIRKIIDIRYVGIKHSESVIKVYINVGRKNIKFLIVALDYLDIPQNLTWFNYCNINHEIYSNAVRFELSITTKLYEQLIKEYTKNE